MIESYITSDSSEQCLYCFPDLVVPPSKERPLDERVSQERDHHILRFFA